jgi:hypothetical protein
VDGVLFVEVVEQALVETWAGPPAVSTRTRSYRPGSILEPGTACRAKTWPTASKLALVNGSRRPASAEIGKVPLCILGVQ